MLRTFSKIYGLAGLRVGYAVAPEEVVTVDREGAAGLRCQLGRAGGCAGEHRRHEELARRRRENAEGLAQLERIMREHGLDPPGRRWGTSSSPRWAKIRGRCSSSSSGKA